MGQAERLALWCRRNPVVSGLTAAVATSLLIGILVSTYFAVQASHRASAENRERRRAENAEKAAVTARGDTERLLARSLVMPLNPDAGRNMLSLSAPEAEGLWELARHAEESLGLLFLDEATRDTTIVRQLRAFGTCLDRCDRPRSDKAGASLGSTGESAS